MTASACGGPRGQEQREQRDKFAMLVITSTIMHGEPDTSAAEAHRRVEPRCSRSTGRGQHRHGDNRWPHSVASSVRSLYTSARSRERAARRDDAEDARDADRNGRNDFRQCLKRRVCEIARLLYEATRKLVQSLSERNTKRAQIRTPQETCVSHDDELRLWRKHFCEDRGEKSQQDRSSETRCWRPRRAPMEALKAAALGAQGSVRGSQRRHCVVAYPVYGGKATWSQYHDNQENR